MSTVGTEGLTRAQLKWLRTARAVSFHHNRHETVIRCTDADDARLDIHVAGTLRGYEGFGERRYEGTAYASHLSAQFTRTWRTLADLLKPGDVLTLNFHGDRFSNGYTKHASGQTEDGVSYGALHADGLELRIDRGDKRLDFIVDATVCPDNSARMVQLGRVIP